MYKQLIKKLRVRIAQMHEAELTADTPEGVLVCKTYQMALEEAVIAVEAEQAEMEAEVAMQRLVETEYD